MTLKLAAALGGLSILAACGGSSTSTGIPSFASAMAVTDEGQAALDRIIPMDLTAASDIPTTGTANFAGTIVINDSDSGAVDASVVGGFAMSVDFANADNVTGTAGNFFDLANTRASGTLELSDVAFASGAAGGGFEGNLTGRLRDVGETGTDTDFDYDLQIATIYYGADVEALVALMGGEATPVGSSTSQSLTGAASLER